MSPEQGPEKAGSKSKWPARAAFKPAFSTKFRLHFLEFSRYYRRLNENVGLRGMTANSKNFSIKYITPAIFNEMQRKLTKFR